MKDAPAPSAAAAYTRAFRERMREQGLVKKDVWIRPEHARELATIERELRQSDRDATSVAPVLEADAGWSLPSIRHALAQTSAVREGHITVETIEAVHPSLHLVMHDYGDLSLFVAVGQHQILVEAYLWPLEHVADVDAFNLHVLRTHKLMPLSTIGVQDIGGVASYVLFGSLDTHSSLQNLMFEIEMLADNAIGASQAYAGHLRAELLADAA